jgi:hypothetical protein
MNFIVGISNLSREWQRFLTELENQKINNLGFSKACHAFPSRFPKHRIGSGFRFVVEHCNSSLVIAPQQGCKPCLEASFVSRAATRV